MKKVILLMLVGFICLTSCKPKVDAIPVVDTIRINQLGFYPTSIKQFMVIDTVATNFEIIDELGGIAFSGTLEDHGTWETSGERVLMGDFSTLREQGSYTVIVDDKMESHPFEITEGLYEEAWNAAIKSYYFQRASMAIEEPFGGIYKRAAGHPDDQCKFHPSSGGSATGVLVSSKGWYDAGDYGKYVVNAALSVGQMLHFIEQYPMAIKDGTLNIPESYNGISDLLDELKYELDWIVTMQDKDGGVYHKLTAKDFSGFIMPENYDLDRYIIGKGTAASLNFAAVLAQASRMYMDFDPQWSENALSQAESAWQWAVKNSNVAFKNPEDVSTGEYGDDQFSDDFYWAAAELYIATRKEEYLTYLMANQEPMIHQLTNSWKFFVRNNGFHSLLENRGMLDKSLAAALVKGQLKLADELLTKINNNPYRIGLDRFEWGSNSDILNQAMILCIAHRLTGHDKFLNGAGQITDYIFGKNATGYSFLTGFGSKKVMFPHHRPSGADGIDEPVPGFIIGGPNNDKQDSHELTYANESPAKSFMDVQASFASNEVCINWNAPAVYVLGYLEQVRNNSMDNPLIRNLRNM
ncbi:MAG: glycoside hydrolase family 9 protein [Aureibaculum sp.]|nr:glycoside hydrolase family 9 protein [Aureibaculum sp.]